jgi:hypothetical protein
MIRQRRFAVAAVFSTVLAATAEADSGAAQFAADMVRRGPDGQVTSGKMFVGDGRTRMEMSQEDREVIRISDQNRRMEWILFPAEQNYLERGGPPGAEGAHPHPQPFSAEANPCEGMPGVTCRRVGVEDVNGRPAVKWEMTATQEGKTLTGAQWLDQERGMPLKSVMPNGPTMELKILGQETIDGRKVEKWEMTITAPKQQPTRTFQWYDPELKLAVREEFPGGYVSELKNIRVGPQPDDLFSVPAGYARMTMPQGGEKPPQGSR